MKPDNPLTLSYVRAHPADAAQALERLSADTAAALIETLDSATAAPLVSALSPPAAAACLAVMGPARAAALLQLIRPAAAALILTAMAPAPARDLLAHLGTTTRLRVRRLLNHMPATVGTLMSPGAPTLAAGLTVGDAIRRVQARQTAPACEIYLVDENHRLVGTLGTGDLLRGGARRPVRTLARHGVTALQSSMSVFAALNHNGWRDHRILPVTERDGTLAGTLDYQTLLDAATTGHDTGHDDPSGGVLELVHLYWIALAETARMIVGTDREPRSR